MIIYSEFGLTNGFMNQFKKFVKTIILLDPSQEDPWVLVDLLEMFGKESSEWKHRSNHAHKVWLIDVYTKI